MAASASSITSTAERLAADIHRNGPITVESYMAACNEAYYDRAAVFGRGGDFITAPEISQVFGELIGLWAAVTWQAMGAPDPVRLVELGPGRGTLMADALRAVNSTVPGFFAASDLHLVERSPARRAEQKATLGTHAVRWHDDIASVPKGPSLIIANEFFDALPVRQFVKTETGWCERMVTLDGNAFRFAVSPIPTDAIHDMPAFANAPSGSVLERSTSCEAITQALAVRLSEQGGAALVIDYGYRQSAPGETLQAVKDHAYANVLAAPGEADLTAHVDFGALAAAAQRGGAKVHGPVDQGVWLRRLGITVRGAQLAAGKSSRDAETIQGAIRRLIEPDGMGLLFKVIAISHPGLTALEGFGETNS